MPEQQHDLIMSSSRSMQSQEQMRFSNMRSNEKKLTFADDLIRLLQVTVIVVLLIIVVVIGIGILEQVEGLWGDKKAEQLIMVSKQGDNQLEKIDENVQSTMKAQDVLSKNDGEVSEFRRVDKLNNNIQKHSIESAGNQPVKNILKPSQQIDKKQQPQNKQIPKEQDQQQEENQQQDEKEEGSVTVPAKPSRLDRTELIDRAAEDREKRLKFIPVDRPSSSLPQVRPRLTPNKVNQQILQHTILPQVKLQQLYDPVLIQLYKTRQRFGQSYPQTIYTQKNTSITFEQYQLSKNLIELTRFFNPKENRHIVRDTEGGFRCREEDESEGQGVGEKLPSCALKQQELAGLLQKQAKYYEQHYPQLAYYNSVKQLPFCLIIPSYKNSNNYIKNLNSILQQTYTNYHAIYIDDASKDGSAQKVREYLQQYEIKQDKVKFIQNQHNQKALKNIYQAATNYCNDRQIMIIVDGDDCLIGTMVLKFLNYQYQAKHLLAAYTNYLRIHQPYYIKVGTSTPYLKSMIDHRSFRRSPKVFRASHLRSYYVHLFKKINITDLQDQNRQFFTAANDFAIMMPILQMAAPNIAYLPELMYLYDSGTQLNNFKTKKEIQERNVKTVAKRKVYDKVSVDDLYEKK